MAYTSHTVHNTSAGIGGGGSSSTPSTSYGRVVHVVLTNDDQYCKNLSMVNGVYYRDIRTPIDEGDISKLPFAYAGNTTMKALPLSGEIVELQNLPGPETLTSPSKTRKYWTKVVNIWNHPHHNASPDTLQGNWKSSLLKGFEEKSHTNALAINPGDTVIEGRLSQTIRLGGAQGAANTVVSTSEKQSPIILISNGQISTTNGSDLIQEDINKDINSLYFLSNHKAPLIAANTKKDSYNTPPTSTDQYKGNQVLVNGGRLVFNAKEESILISAKQSVGINANTLNFDATDYMCIDAGKIYLGKAARTAFLKEPVVLGVQLENWMNSLLSALNGIAIAMQTATAVGAGPVTSLVTQAGTLQSQTQALRDSIKNFKSNKVYTE
jgi:hypothetical protein